MTTESPIPGTPSSRSGISGRAPGELQRLGRYLIERKLGAGGMGAVYLARDPQLNRLAALKVLPRDKAQNPTLVKRFKAEAQSAAQLRHDNVVAVYDSGEDDGYLYIAMEYVEGTDLHEFVRKRGPVPVRRSIELIRQVASALQHAHQQNIVHRDIKPSNLLLSRNGTIKLTDFGLARSIDDTIETNITRAGTTVGTVDFMSPEQARSSKAADVRSDLYSLGCTWFHMLTGKPPFPDGALTNKLQAHATQPVPNPQSDNPAITEALVAILNRLMAKKPADRYQTPQELLDDLNSPGLTRQSVEQEILSALDDDSTIIRPFGSLPIDLAEAETKEERTDIPPADDLEKQPSDPQSPRPRRRLKGEKSDKSLEDSSPTSPVKAAKTEPDDFAERLKLKKGRRDRKAGQKSDASGKSEDSGKAEATNQPAANSAKSKAKKQLKRGGGYTELLPDEPKGTSLESLKSIVFIVLAIVGVAGLGWIMLGFGASFFDTQPLTLQDLTSSDGPRGPAEIVGSAGVKPAEAGEEKKTKKDEPAEKLAGETPNTPPEPLAANEAAQKAQAAIEELRKARKPFELPEWVKSVEAASEPQQVIRVGPREAVTSLAAGLIASKKGNVVLELVGSSVFPVNAPLTIPKQVVIRPAAKTDQPFLLWRTTSQPGTGVTVDGGTLMLEDLHLVVDRTRSGEEGADTFLETSRGTSVLKNCTMTVLGESKRPLRLFSGAFQGAVASEEETPPLSQILVDRCVLRGHAVDVLHGSTDLPDFVIRQSLVVLDGGTFLSIIARGKDQSQEAKEGTAPAVSQEIGSIPPLWQVFESTVWTTASLLKLSGQSSETPWLRQISFRDSLLVGGSGQTPTLVKGTWPNQGGAIQEGRLKNLQIFTENVAAVGFPQLVDVAGNLGGVTEGADWERFSGAGRGGVEVLKSSWAALENHSWDALRPAQFDAITLPQLVSRSRQGGPPGCDVRELPWPEGFSHARVVAWALRPAPPLRLPAIGRPTEIVDLHKTDLGVHLNRKAVPDNATIIARGSGIREISPFRVENRNMRIVFEQTEGPPLVLIPKRIAVTAAESWITVQQGSLILEGGLLQFTPASRSAGLKWMLSGQDAQVRLERCYLRDASGDHPKPGGLVRWQTGVSSDPANSPDLAVIDSYWRSSKTLLSATMGRGRLYFENSLLVGQGTGLSLEPVVQNDACDAILEANHLSLCCGGTAVEIRGGASTRPLIRPFRAYWENSAFLPPFAAGMPGGSPASALVSLQGRAATDRQWEWWGQSNGISPDIPRFLIGEQIAADSREASWQAWLKQWGEDHHVRCLREKGSLLLADGGPENPQDERPARYGLLKTCPAATWASGGMPLGARMDRLSEHPARAIKAPTPTNKATGKPGVKSTKPSF